MSISTNNPNGEENETIKKLEALHKSNVETVKKLLNDLDCHNRASILCTPLILISSIICLISCFCGGYYMQQTFFNVNNMSNDNDYDQVPFYTVSSHAQSRNVLSWESTLKAVEFKQPILTADMQQTIERRFKLLTGIFSKFPDTQQFAISQSERPEEEFSNFIEDLGLRPELVSKWKNQKRSPYEANAPIVLILATLQDDGYDFEKDLQLINLFKTAADANTNTFEKALELMRELKPKLPVSPAKTDRAYLCEFIAPFAIESLPTLKTKFTTPTTEYENNDFKRCTPIHNDPRKNEKLIPTIQEDIDSAYPIFHFSEIQEMQKFVTQANGEGSKYLQVYTDAKPPIDGIEPFIERILNKKQWAFFGAQDFYLGRNGQFGVGNPELESKSEFELQIPAPDKLSYEEMLFNAKAALSSQTQFINDCNRGNNGQLGHQGKYIESGIFIALVGPRFERQNKMEYKVGKGEMVENVDDGNCNRPEMYQQQSDYNKKTRAHGKTECLNLQKLRARYRISMELFLFDAQFRGESLDRDVYARIAGIGAGFFGFDDSAAGAHATYTQLIASIIDIVEATRILDKIKVLDFYYFKAGQEKELIGGLHSICDYVENLEFWTCFYERKEVIYHHKQSQQKITMIWTKNSMASPIESKYKTNNMLLVATNAMDSNSFPGNEYYLGFVAASNEPAIAACSTIVWTQNPTINSKKISPKHAIIYDGDGKRYECTFEDKECRPQLTHLQIHGNSKK